MLKGAEGGWLIVMDVHPSKRRSHMYLLHGARVNRCSSGPHCERHFENMACNNMLKNCFLAVLTLNRMHFSFILNSLFLL